MSHDDLIQRIRRRAWDPARRHDRVYVPLDWLKREYGENLSSRIHHTQQPHRAWPSSLRFVTVQDRDVAERIAAVVVASA